MLLKEIINKSHYGVIGYVSSLEDISRIEQYISYNLQLLKEFKNIIIATNYSNLELNTSYHQLWKSYFPNCILIDSKVNRGHNHGNADLDNIIFDYCKDNNIDWVCKSAIDVIIQDDILNKEIIEADFYYLNGIGYGGMFNYNFDFDRIINENFYPQTNFYFINISKCDFLNNKKYLDETYDHIQTIPGYNGNIWEYISGWSCEDFLKQCVERNNLFKYHLVSKEKYNILLNVIKYNQMHDCSHKNIMIEGICHFHFPNQQVIVL